MVGHSPIEISRTLYFVLEHGCLRAIDSEAKYYPSPLVQAGFEIKVEVTSCWTKEAEEFGRAEIFV